MGDGLLPHSSHWGAFSAALRNGELEVRADPRDPAPARLLENFSALLDPGNRLLRPLVRRGWLENGPGADSRRGRDEFVPLGWDRAIELLSAELRRVACLHGPGAIYGGSYGWSSAGRFHHAQSQVHRFLNTVMGGYVRSVNTYSNGTAAVLLPHVLGDVQRVTRDNDDWTQLAEHSELIVAFGGISTRNASVSSGGNSRHVASSALARAAARRAHFVLIGPIGDDMPDLPGRRWLPVMPGTDTALGLGLAHVLAAEDLLDRDFLHRATTGFERFEAYLTGGDGTGAKTPEWAAGICGVPADTIRNLAREMAARRTLITVSYSLQRQRFGEQPVWIGLTLAAMLGQMAEPGCGFSFGLGSIGNVGKAPLAVPLPRLPQGRNVVADFIPVARIADMLLRPGDSYAYDGQTLSYPDIRLVYWAGGNPFHHHQDLARLAEAFARPDTVVVHEAVPTASAAHADIVLPVTTTLERDDIGAAGNDPVMVAMQRIAPPPGDAIDDFEIFSRLARALGREAAFTERRSAAQWLRHLCAPTFEALGDLGHSVPDFDAFWAAGRLELPVSDKPGFLRAFAADPEGAPLTTPSGRIEIHSARIESFGYADCPGHPAWLGQGEAEEYADWPIVLVANQPARRLHSQLDFGAYSQAGKTAGRETVRLNPHDAAARGIRDGMLVEICNGRGACLAGARLSAELRPGVAHLPTGAWYRPAAGRANRVLCLAGNPNVLTRDVPTSTLSQGCAGQITRVEIKPFTGPVPEAVRWFDPAAQRLRPDAGGITDRTTE